MSSDPDRLAALLAARRQVAAQRAEQVAARPPVLERREPGSTVDMRAAQARLAFVQRLDPDSTAYNVTAEIDLAHDVDPDRLAAAVRELAVRHDVLRQVVDGDRLRLAELPERMLEVVDTLDAGSALSAAAARPFDLGRDLPMRAVLVRTASSATLLLVVHHIATDAWSNAVLLDDLAALYHGRPLPAPRQYADTPEPQYAADLAWWVGQLTPPAPVLDIPTDRPGPTVTDPSGRHVAVDLPPTLADGVRAAAARCGATVTAVLLAALRLLLRDALGVEDVVVGIPDAGRAGGDQDRVVGAFVNTLPVRGGVGRGRTATEAIAGAARDLRAALDHRAAPFDRIVAAVEPERRLDTTPVFQVLLNVAPTVVAEPTEALYRSRPRPRWTHTARADLAVMVERLGGAGEPMATVLTTRAAAMDPETTAAWARWWQHAVAALVGAGDAVPQTDLDGALSAPLLTGGPPSPLPGATLLDHVSRWVRERPDALAVAGPDGELTWRRLWELSESPAKWLRGNGSGPVGVYLDRSVDLVVGLVGCWRAGRAYLPLDPAYPPDRIRGALTSAGAQAVLTHRFLRPDLDPAEERPWQVLDLDGPLPPTPPGTVPVPTLAPSDLAYVVTTSGSTGLPKAVAVTHAGLLDYLGGALPRLGVRAESSFALASTHAADLGMTCLMGVLAGGGTLHLIDRSTAGDPAAFADLLRDRPVDVLKLVPSQLEMLGAHGELADVLPRRLLLLAGEPVPWTLVERVRRVAPGLAVHTSYGPTETTVAVSCCDTSSIADADRRGAVPLGTPYPGVEFAVLDPDGRPLPRGLPGELAIGGPSVGAGYLGGADERARSRFCGSPFPASAAADWWYRTGDLVRVRHDDLIEVRGRADDQVKVRGNRVELDDVAAACQEVPGVAAAVVLPTGDGHHRRLTAWVATTDPGRTPAEIRSILRDRVPDYMIPSAIVVLDELPLAPSGKIDRTALAVPDTAPATVARMPATPRERTVADAFHAVLGDVEIDADTDFFAAGGDSFGAVRLAAALDGVSVLDVFRHPTAADLAGLLDRRAAEQAAATAPARAWPLGRPLLQQLSGPGPSRRAALTVVCVPYGGGAAVAYGPLAAALPPEWDVLAVELPGHDPLDPDEPLQPADEVVRQLATEIGERTGGPVLVYGHCLGGSLAIALAQMLERSGTDLVGTVLGGTLPAARLPGRLARAAARALPTDRFTPDRTYKEVLGVLGGLDDPDGADEQERARGAAMLRALRHDARQAEEIATARLAAPAAAGSRLRAPVLVVVGERDRTTELYAERYLEWAAFAERVELATIPRAGHYFLKHQAAQLAAHVRRSVGRWRRGDHPAYVDPAAVREQFSGLRTFGLVAAAQTLSLIGTSLSGFGLAVHVLQQTGDVLRYALVTMLAALPAILIAPVGGAVADRIDRRLVMLAADASAGLSTAALAALWWSGNMQLWQLYAVVAVGSVATAFHRPAWLAAITVLVPKPFLTQANAIAQIGTGLGTLIAPVAGGAILVTGGLGALLVIDLVSFAVGASVLLLVRFPRRLHRHRDESFGRSLLGGWRYVLRRPPMVAMTSFFVVANLLLAVPLVLAGPITLAIGDAALLGVVTAIGGAGAIAGSLLMVAWGGTARRVIGMVGFTAGIGLGSIVMGLRPQAWAVGLGLALVWFGLNVLNVHWLAIIQRKVGWDLQARVIAANQMLATSAMPLGFVLTAPLVELGQEAIRTWPWLAALLGGGPARPEAVALVAVGVVLIGWTALGLRWPPLRDLEDRLPDAIPPAEVSADLDELQAAQDRALAGRHG